MTIQTVVGRDPNGSFKQETLQVLSQQVVLLNERLGFLEALRLTPAGTPLALGWPRDASVNLGKLARKIHHFRSRRQRIMPADLLGEAFYDMLLDLYASECERKRVSVTSLCIASGVSPTTALRWITVGIQRGMMHKHHDPRDKRRAYVTLTNDGRTVVEKMLKELAECVGNW